MTSKILKLLLCSVALLSCRKEKAYIENIRPQNGTVFDSGAHVVIEADLSHDDQLSGQYLTVTTGSAYDDTILNFADHKSVHYYYLKKEFIAQSRSQYKIRIGANGPQQIVADSVYVSCK